MELGHTVGALVLGMPRMFVGGEPRVRAGEERLASRKLGALALPELSVESPAFLDGRTVPVRFTVEGEGLEPPLLWRGAPPGTRSWVVLVEDPDAPTPQPFVHLLAVLPREAAELSRRGDSGIVWGRTTMMKTGWVPCAPPKGDLPHQYHFQVFALADTLEVGHRPGRSAVLRAMRDKLLGFGETVGTYWR